MAPGLFRFPRQYNDVTLNPLASRFSADKIVEIGGGRRRCLRSQLWPFNDMTFRCSLEPGYRKGLDLNSKDQKRVLGWFQLNVGIQHGFSLRKPILYFLSLVLLGKLCNFRLDGRRHSIFSLGGGATLTLTCWIDGLLQQKLGTNDSL